MQPELAPAARSDTVSLFLAGDVMTGRGIDQIMPHPADAQIYESYLKSAEDYVRLAEQANGPIPRPVAFPYVWGDALPELERRQPDARIINLETAITNRTSPEPKGINYKMNPANVGVITAAAINCCVLANNHVLDWGRAGLLDSLATLEKAGVSYTGGGQDDVAAAIPAVLALPGKGRVLIFAFASPTAGVPVHWTATEDAPGLNLVLDLNSETLDVIGRQIRAIRNEGDIVIVSIHWGGNWGYEIPREQFEFAHQLIEEHHVDIVHGHSSHHVKGIEVHRGKLILYGSGDFIDDYEGIEGHEEFRGDLVLMYFPTLQVDNGSLISLEMVPLQMRKMRLNYASREDAEWLATTLNGASMALKTRVRLDPDNVLRLVWR